MRREISVGGYGGFVGKKGRGGKGRGECGKIEGRRERKKLGGNYARLRVNSIESNESDVRDLIFKFLRIRKLSKLVETRILKILIFSFSFFFFVSKEGECLFRRELKNFKKF